MKTVRLADVRLTRLYAREQGKTEGDWLTREQIEALGDCEGELVDGRWLGIYGTSDRHATLVGTLARRTDSLVFGPEDLAESHFRTASPDHLVGDVGFWLNFFFLGREDSVLDDAHKRADAWLEANGECLICETDTQYAALVASEKQRSPAESLQIWREAVLGERSKGAPAS